MSGHKKAHRDAVRFETGKSANSVGAVGLVVFGLLGFGSRFFVFGFVLGGFLEFFDRLAEAFREGREFGSAKKDEEDDENDTELGGAHTEDACEDWSGSSHSVTESRPRV
jgi:hypothetical protein